MKQPITDANGTLWNLASLKFLCEALPFICILRNHSLSSDTSGLIPSMVTRADHVSHIVLCIELAETSHVIRRELPSLLVVEVITLSTLFNECVSPSL